jgi:putative transposase
LRLDKAYKAFFKRVSAGYKAGLPRFKNKNRYDSFTLTQTGWKLDGKYLTIKKVGIFKIKLSRPIGGTIKTITIKRSNDKWYACFSCDNVPEKQYAPSKKEIGIDVGLKSFAVDSDGKVTDNPKYLDRVQRKLRIKQRTLSRRKKGSTRRSRACKQVTNIHEKVRNQRKDFLHKLSSNYVKNNQKIYVENLNVKGMVRNHNLSRSISDAGWSTFISMLEYKAEEAGRQVVKIPRFEPSSKTCSVCGSINDNLKLSDRQWICENCGTLHDRDFNAAKNILMVGQTIHELTYTNR